MGKLWPLQHGHNTSTYLRGNTMLLLLACTPPPSTCQGDRFVQVEAGLNVECQLDNTGCLQCQGMSDPDMLNALSYAEPTVPASPPEGTFSQFSVVQFAEQDETFGKIYYGCAVDLSGALQCWDGKQVGETVDVFDEFVYPLPTETAFQAVAAGPYNIYALATDGTLWNLGGKYDVPGTYQKVDAGWGLGCALSLSGELVCIDVSRPGTQAGIPCPTPPSGTTCWEDTYLRFRGTFRELAAADYLCALDEENRIHCWFARDLYEKPEKFPYGNQEVYGQALCNYCALQLDGTVLCMLQRDASPVFDVPLTSLSCSTSICGLTESGEARCWNEERGMWAIKPGDVVR